MGFVTQILEWRKSTSNVFCEIVVLVVNRLQELHRQRWVDTRAATDKTRTTKLGDMNHRLLFAKAA